MSWSDSSPDIFWMDGKSTLVTMAGDATSLFVCLRLFCDPLLHLAEDRCIRFLLFGSDVWDSTAALSFASSFRHLYTLRLLTPCSRANSDTLRTPFDCLDTSNFFSSGNSILAFLPGFCFSWSTIMSIDCCEYYVVFFNQDLILMCVLYHKYKSTNWKTQSTPFFILLWHRSHKCLSSSLNSKCHCYLSYWLISLRAVISLANYYLNPYKKQTFHFNIAHKFTKKGLRIMQR